jgi:hypothetical protein
MSMKRRTKGRCFSFIILYSSSISFSLFLSPIICQKIFFFLLKDKPTKLHVGFLYVDYILLKYSLARCRTRCFDMWVRHHSMFVLRLLEVIFRTRSLKILSENIFVFLARQEACCYRRFRHMVSRACFYLRKPYIWFGNMLHTCFKNMLLGLKLSSSPCSSKAI